MLGQNVHLKGDWIRFALLQTTRVADPGENDADPSYKDLLINLPH